MSTHRPHRPYDPRCIASIRSFAIIFALTLVCLLPSGAILGAPAESVPISTLHLQSGPWHSDSLGQATHDGNAKGSSKNGTPPPSEEDPEVDEIDPLTGGLDRLLMVWLKRFFALLS